MIFTTVLLESVVLASIYLQIALAWIVIFRATRVLNFATGQFLLLPALVFSTATLAGLHPALAVLISLVVTVGVAMASYDLMLKPLAGRPIFTQIIVTVGLAIVMTSAMRLIWGNQPRSLPQAIPKDPHYLPGGAILTTLDLTILGLSLATFVLLLLFLQRSKLGRQMRAAAEAPLLASQTGLNITSLNRLSWAMTGVATVLAGVAFAHLTLVSQSIVELGLRGIAPALVGGLDSVRGAIVGALVIAAIENLAAVYFGGDVRNVVPFAVIMIVLLIRPYGLFGTPEVRRV